MIRIATHTTEDETNEADETANLFSAGQEPVQEAIVIDLVTELATESAEPKIISIDELFTESIEPVQEPVAVEPVAELAIESITEHAIKQTAGTEVAFTGSLPSHLTDIQPETDSIPTGNPDYQRWLALLQEHEKNVCDLSIEVSKDSSALKDLKTQLKEAVNELDDFKSDGYRGWKEDRERQQVESERLRKELTKSASDENAMQSNQSSTTAGQSTPSTSITKTIHDRTNEDWWKSIPTTELDFSEVKGFGDKKKEAFFERCPTMGEFEAVRATFERFTSIKGIGEKLSGELENIGLNWLTGNRDKFGEVASGGMESPDENAINATPAETPSEQVISETYMTAEEWDSLTDEQQNEQRDGLHITLVAEPYNQETIQPNFKSGHEAQGKGWAIHDCPHPPSREMDSWLLGYIHGQNESESIQNANEREESEASPEPTRAIELIDTFPDTGDGMKELFKKIKSDPTFTASFTPDPDQFSAGYNSQQIGEPWVHCTESPGPSRISWLTGYLAALNELKPVTESA